MNPQQDGPHPEHRTTIDRRITQDPARQVFDNVEDRPASDPDDLPRYFDLDARVA
jgi:hypothetical protein